MPPLLGTNTRRRPSPERKPPRGAPPPPPRRPQSGRGTLRQLPPEQAAANALTCSNFLGPVRQGWALLERRRVWLQLHPVVGLSRESAAARGGAAAGATSTHKTWVFGAETGTELLSAGITADGALALELVRARQHSTVELRFGAAAEAEAWRGACAAAASVRRYVAACEASGAAVDAACAEALRRAEHGEPFSVSGGAILAGAASSSLRVLSVGHRLTAVALSGCRLTDGDASGVLRALSAYENRDLVRFDVSRNGLTEAGFSPAVATALPLLRALQVLNVGRNALADQFAAQLAGAVLGGAGRAPSADDGARPLLSLDVSDNAIGRAGAGKLVAAAFSAAARSQIVSLVLDGIVLGDSGALAIAELSAAAAADGLPGAGPKAKAPLEVLSMRR